MFLELTPSPNSHETSKEKTTKKCGLQDTLPKDVLGCILDHITRNRDFKNLCLTSKTLYHLILPRFYRKFIMPVYDHTAEKFSSLLIPDHKGLPMIREIVIFPWTGAWKKEESVEYMNKLFTALRKGQLDHFDIRSTVGMPSTLTKLLWSTQPNLKNLDLSTEREDYLPDICSAVGTTPFSSLVQVRLFPENEAALRTASKTLQTLTFCKLHINGSHFGTHEATVENATGNVTYPFTEALFQHRKDVTSSSGDSRWDGLKSLTFVDIDFRFCRKTWLRHWDFSNLWSLQLHHCQGVETLLEELMEDGAPKLTDFYLTHDLGEADPDDFIEVVNRFLKSIKGRLRRLEIVLRNTPLPVSPKLVNIHAETIRILVLDIMRTSTDERSHYEWTPAQLKRMLTGCDNLTQLGLGLPSSYVEYPDFDLTDTHGDFSRALNVIFEHTDPIVLNILNWPEDFEWDRPNRPGPKAKRTLIERLAGDIFNAAAALPRRRRRRLDIIAFGVYETVSSRQPFRESFVRADSWASVGWYQTGAMVAHCMHCLRSEGLEVDVFDHDIREWDAEKRREADVSQKGDEDEVVEESGQAEGDDSGEAEGEDSGEVEEPREEGNGGDEGADQIDQVSGLDEGRRQDDAGDQGGGNAEEQLGEQDEPNRPDEVGREDVAAPDGEPGHADEPSEPSEVETRDHVNQQSGARKDEFDKQDESSEQDETSGQCEVSSLEHIVTQDGPETHDGSNTNNEHGVHGGPSGNVDASRRDPVDSVEQVPHQDGIRGQDEAVEEDEIRSLTLMSWS